MVVRRVCQEPPAFWSREVVEVADPQRGAIAGIADRDPGVRGRPMVALLEDVRARAVGKRQIAVEAAQPVARSSSLAVPAAFPS